jgi:hypothetical protein
MNINEIYNLKLDFFAKEVADMYNRFAKDIEKDPNFTLSDDELGELFDELLISFMRKQMSAYEFERVANKESKDENGVPTQLRLPVYYILSDDGEITYDEEEMDKCLDEIISKLPYEKI